MAAAGRVVAVGGDGKEPVTVGFEFGTLTHDKLRTASFTGFATHGVSSNTQRRGVAAGSTWTISSQFSHDKPCSERRICWW